MNRRVPLVLFAATILLAACGDSDREMAGFRREPPPEVGELSLPDLSNGGDEFDLRADPGEILALYFGYTNCPDFCPTTLSDLKIATSRLDDPDQVDVAMITVDPDRDLAVLDDYVTSFFPAGHPLGTDDADRLAETAAPFGVSYEVGENDDGEIEVGHTTALYAIDDAGNLVLTWPFGVSIADLAADLRELLDEATA